VPLPLVVLLDGECFLLGMDAPRIFDDLVRRGAPRFVAALVHNPSLSSRIAEYPCNPDFPRFLADELLPELRRRYPLVGGDRVVVGGYSYGGLAACWTGYSRPDTFTDVLALSPSLWWGSPHEWLTQRYAAAARMPLRFWLDVGTLEVGPLGVADPSVTMLSVSRRLHEVLLERGYDVGYRERTRGHDFVNWRQALADGLPHLLARGRMSD
jgi:enterochelin esterase family protein